MAILPASSKIIERVIHQQVSTYLKEHKILSNAQFRFRKGHPISTYILYVLNDLYLNMDHKHITGVVFLDLKKAFDMVDHNILCKKTHYVWLRTKIVTWFKDYLKNRTQRTGINGVVSDE